MMSKSLNDRLLDAATKGQTKNIGVLIASGADVNYTDQYGKSPLQEACRKGHLKSVKTLLDRGANPVAQNMDLTGKAHFESILTYTLIFCEKNKFEVVKLLCEAGVDLKCKNRSNGDSPLVMLTYTQNRYKNKEMAACLLDHGIDYYKDLPYIRTVNQDLADFIVSKMESDALEKMIDGASEINQKNLQF